MRIAMTGASGFIGSYAAKALAGDGHQVVALVRPGSRTEHVEQALAERVKGTLGDPAARDRLCAGADCVVHAAADWQALRAGYPEHVQTNLLGSLGLLESARRAGAAQFIFFSSISVYHEVLPDRALDEAHPAWPDNPYGAAKAAVEPFLKACHFEYGMNTVSLRPGGVYGIDPRLERSWYFGLVRKVVNNEPIDTDRGGKIVSVRDCAEAVRRCVGNPAVAGRFFVLVDCYLYDQEVAEMARTICGSASDIADRKGSGPANRFDTSAARGLGVPLNRGREGVREYLEELIEAMK
jgi:nucleoside-diphosphate-sugar epimerase